MPTLKNIKKSLSFALLMIVSTQAYAKKTADTQLQYKEKFEACLFSEIKSADKDATFAGVEELCEIKMAESIITAKNSQVIKLGALAHRMIKENRSAFDPYIITPHKMNYILPASITNAINKEAYKAFPSWSENFEDVEAKFQLSIKVPLLTSNLFVAGDQLFFGFTIESWWQLYSENISKPFRETNYQPEFFYMAPINFHPLGGNSAIIVGMEHQSNGRSQALSRSWNRVYLTYLYEKQNFALSFKPWYRISEEAKETPFSSDGDDNPDILDYMGHFELGMAYKFNDDYELSFRGRENFSTHNGFAEVGITFPLWGKLKGYAQFSSGYGESLIDYNYNQQRFGIGIALTQIL